MLDLTQPQSQTECHHEALIHMVYIYHTTHSTIWLCCYLLKAGWPLFSNKGKDAHPQLNSLTSPVFYKISLAKLKSLHYITGWEYFIIITDAVYKYIPLFWQWSPTQREFLFTRIIWHQKMLDIHTKIRINIVYSNGNSSAVQATVVRWSLHWHNYWTLFHTALYYYLLKQFPSFWLLWAPYHTYSVNIT